MVPCRPGGQRPSSRGSRFMAVRKSEPPGHVGSGSANVLRQVPGPVPRLAGTSMFERSRLPSLEAVLAGTGRLVLNARTVRRILRPLRQGRRLIRIAASPQFSHMLRIRPPPGRQFRQLDNVPLVTRRRDRHRHACWLATRVGDAAGYSGRNKQKGPDGRLDFLASNPICGLVQVSRSLKQRPPGVRRVLRSCRRFDRVRPRGPCDRGMRRPEPASGSTTASPPCWP